MKEEILKLLRDTEGFVSGQELCESFGVSRTAVWKAIRQLKKDGYDIEAVTNKGYRLACVQDADLINQAEIENNLRTKWVGHPFFFKTRTGSTNDDILALSDKGYASGTIVASTEQTKGKGRRGRTWLSPEGGNIYMSILLKPQIPAAKAPMCTLIMALALYQALQELDVPENIRFGIKWPNDLVVSVDGESYKKIAGILTEMRLEETEIKDVVIGTGVNINLTEMPEEVSSTASSIALALGRRISRAALTASCWNHFEKDFEAFEKACGFEPLKKEYEAALVNLGRRVKVLDPKGEYEGTAIGLADDGELIVRTDDGTVQVIGSGEISVRGVMGYV